jgi:hypothetical protein
MGFNIISGSMVHQLLLGTNSNFTDGLGIGDNFSMAKKPIDN